MLSYFTKPNLTHLFILAPLDQFKQNKHWVQLMQGTVKITLWAKEFGLIPTRTARLLWTIELQVGE
jgi:hypothetical protein